MKQINGRVTPDLLDFVERREKVVEFVRANLIDRGMSKLEASDAVMRIYSWKFSEADNLYKCITSGWDELVIKSIVMHDFNGMGSDSFVPKSEQFGE